MADDGEFDCLSEKICSKFQVSELNSLQVRVLKAYRDSKDVLICSKTGSGKSLMYQQTIFSSKRSQPIVVVMVPLLSIMVEHTEKLRGLGFTATYIGRDKDENDDILAGRFDFIYGSPEEFVGTDKWRTMLADKRDQIAAIVVDEAHTVINWGEAQADEAPFREWFSKIGEIRSLCPGIQLIAGTATANEAKRKKIMKSLCMNIGSTAVVIDSPDRENIKLTVKCVKATHDLMETFGWIKENLQPDFPRQLIFCRTIKECSAVYGALVDIVSSHDMETAKLVGMYHSKTPDRIKEKIRDDMGLPNGKIRVIVCTNAAGMGVNFAHLNSVVHYGPPCDTDTFLQQIGRAGRSGEQAQNILIYHKRQLKKIEPAMLEYTKNEDKCRRDVLLS